MITTEKKRGDGAEQWWSWPLGIVVAIVLIVWPQWSFALALVMGAAWAWLEDTNLGEDPDESS